MERFTGLIGVVLIFAIAFLMSNNRKAINYKLVFSGLAIQISLAVFILKIPIGKSIFAWLGDAVTKILNFSQAGAAFVFGPLVNTANMSKAFGNGNEFIFFFNIIPTIIFVAVLVSVAYYLGIMQRIVKFIAYIVYKLMGVSGSEALSNVASAFVGQVEAQIMIKPYLKGMTMSELLASMTGSMACIAGGVMAVYIALGVPAEYLIAASLMAAPAALVISKIVWPETEISETKGRVSLEIKKTNANLVDAISHGASDGLKVGLNVVAMLIGFIAIIALVDFVLGKIGFGLHSLGLSLSFIGINLQTLSLNQILGSLFSIFAYAMGVPGKDIQIAGSLMGTKMVINEFVAYLDLAKIKETLDPKTILITSFALCGFANFSSIAIQVGGIGELSPERRTDLAKLGMRALICGTLASYLSATIAGILM
ncbi:MAG: NupC/NupG family nucleoside CNT transporter [Sphingobacteriales bacterium 17-39-43]|uniref:NupC/NupG family nucleoside CNT transporter n=1 Tax=Daejeonella sp. TaxID=2805397 RepID=UPI000BDCA78A|nr:nucleoside transporter C-terminal domain-containing protein [Daejeonella sp.]MCF8452688.1 NupC/NupG family nucleoside CNT transporter [Pedobacter sp.]OYZ33069.1 MAG: NupC/NupG family nucleoside CNT transporter [Sphingobacteriales bacterium 16-39-50]OZA26478.1 MAG: NupC/NupG family nucleoside CNT transporter [Sphingobacteriales bacterium 17-39-43]HQT21620.1 nucleoside transporter C-terminal domain-containing protein [Daejeonella sp.]HQT56351.1 nucleoside transporter C-terminal domain-contain